MNIENFYNHVLTEVNNTPWAAEYSRDDSGIEECLTILGNTTFTMDQIKSVINDSTFDKSNNCSPRDLYHNPEESMEQKFRWLRSDLSMLVDLPSHSESAVFI